MINGVTTFEVTHPILVLGYPWDYLKIFEVISLSIYLSIYLSIHRDPSIVIHHVQSIFIYKYSSIIIFIISHHYSSIMFIINKSISISIYYSSIMFNHVQSLSICFYIDLLQHSTWPGQHWPAHRLFDPEGLSCISACAA